MDWKDYQLGELCSFKYGVMPKAEDRVEDGAYPIFSGYGVVGKSNSFHYEDKEVVVVARGEGGTGNVRLSPAKCFLTNLAIVVLPRPEIINKRFLYYRLQYPSLWSLRTGSAQSQITIERLQRYEVKIPRRSCQDAIANILGGY